MFDSAQKIDHFLRLLLPGICVLVLLLLSLLQLGLDGMALFPIDVGLISIYYWTIFRPSTMPFWFIFLLGIIRDALMFAPLGMSSLIFILYRLIVLSQQPLLAKEAFWAMWLGFGLTIIPILTLHWLLFCAYTQALLPVMPLAMQWVLTLGLYPLLHIVFNALYSFLPEQAGRSKTTKLL